MLCNDIFITQLFNDAIFVEIISTENRKTQ
jgi:hypothetical protein